MRILGVADSPRSVTSFALTTSDIMHLTRNHEWHLCAMDYPSGNFLRMHFDSGKPDEFFCIHASGAGRNENFPNYPVRLPQLIEEIHPDCLWSQSDTHTINWFPQTKKDIPWIAYFPLDNETLHPQERELIRYMNIPITQSDFSKSVIENAGVKCKRIYLPVNGNIFRPDREARKAYFKASPFAQNKFIVLFVGRPNFRKMIFHMLTAYAKFARHKDDTLLIMHADVNDPAWGYTVMELIHALGIGNKVFFSNVTFDMGVPREQMNAMYNSADVYYSLDAGEGFGLPRVEAMLCGLPNIGTDYSTMPEFVGGKGPGLAERGYRVKISVKKEMRGILRPWPDINDAANALEMYYKNREFGLHDKIAMRKWALSQFSPEIIGKQWQEVFESINVRHVEWTL
jgi:glycosyltransferase involved in cell wall biosynthesis